MNSCFHKLHCLLATQQARFRWLLSQRDTVDWLIGTLTSKDDYINENGKKQYLIGLAQQNNNFASASRSLVHFVAVIAHFVISRFVKVVIRRQELSVFLFLNFDTVLTCSLTLTPKNSQIFGKLSEVE